MICGVDWVFIVPPIALLVIAILYVLVKRGDPGTGSGVASFVQMIVYGAFILFILFIVWVALYYMNGGH